VRAVELAGDSAANPGSGASASPASGAAADRDLQRRPKRGSRWRPNPGWRQSRRPVQPLSHSLLKARCRKAEPGLDHGQATIEARLDGREGSASDFGDLL